MPEIIQITLFKRIPGFRLPRRFVHALRARTRFLLSVAQVFHRKKKTFGVDFRIGPAYNDSEDVSLPRA